MSKLRTILPAALLACMVFAGCSAGAEPPAPTPEPEAVETAEAPAGTADAQGEEDTAPPAPDIEEEPPEPVAGEQIADGTYAVSVTSSSSMFRIVDARLTVEGGEMTAVLTLSGTGYEKLYPGTAEQALADGDDAQIYFVEDEEGRYTYTVPVEALNVETDIAAWSTRKQKWYDRVLVFASDGLPDGAVAQGDAQ